MFIKIQAKTEFIIKVIGRDKKKVQYINTTSAYK